jgi:D-alanyl-D-alanine carboxypeptidase/D-alanyl-D-alanine-endopeptidase (penicillin-binding protein 4)
VVIDPVSAPWTRAIDDVVRDHPVSVAVGAAGTVLYQHDGNVPRMPASNEKLLTSMVALDTLGADHRFSTAAAVVAPPQAGTVAGDVWLVGSGDPELSSERLTTLALRVRAAGVRTIRGSVIGDTSPFTREWWARGWIRNLSRAYVARPTALAVANVRTMGAPERFAAAAVTDALRDAGVRVLGEPRAGASPRNVRRVAVVRSSTLRGILARQNHDSINFTAEMLTKALGALAIGGRGSTSTGASFVEAWVEDRGVRARVEDGSGLSHLDRLRTVGMVSLLMAAEREPWGAVLRASLPIPGSGTLSGRLTGVPVRAKTGTLFVTPASALSGFVVPATGARLAFSIFSRGMSKSTATVIEDSIVRVLASARL